MILTVQECSCENISHQRNETQALWTESHLVLRNAYSIIQGLPLE